jgi:large subunit ribosomal protein L30
MYIAALLIRGRINLNPQVLETLDRLNLKKKNTLVLLHDTPSTRGMLKRAESYITYGPISEELARRVVEERGLEAKELKQRLPKTSYKIENSQREYYGKKVRPFFPLNNPKGGFERGGIKTPYSKGGVLGYRKEGMDSLVSRMI